MSDGTELGIMSQMFLYRPGARMQFDGSAMMTEMLDLVKQGFPRPMLVGWHCTPRCNLACKYCLVPVAGARSPELDHTDALRLIQAVANAGVKAFTFTGGEPLLRADLVELVAFSVKQGMETYLMSNGVLLSNTVVTALKTAGLRGLYISGDAPDRKLWAAIKGYDYFPQVVQSIQQAKSLGIDVYMTMGVTKQNLEQFDAYVDLAVELRANAVYVWCPMAPPEYAHTVLNPQERHAFERRLYLKSKTYRNKLPLLMQPCYGNWTRTLVAMAQEEGNQMEVMRFEMMEKMTGGCMAARWMCGISPEGEMLPCGADDGIAAGNVLEEGLINLWQNSPIMRAVRNREVKGLCGTCQLKETCGGCRVNAYLATGDVLETDYTCILAAEAAQNRVGQGLQINVNCAPASPG